MSVPPIRSKWQHGTDAFVRQLTAEKDATLARIAELERENAELKKDAERYRWLRNSSDSPIVSVGYATDAMIDAAIASEKENERGR